MPRKRIVECGVCLFLIASMAVAARVPLAVSPAAEVGVAVIDSRCPTFSWGSVAGARTYELAVFRVGGGEAEEDAELVKRIPGTALSWTPALGECLEMGESYAWSVRVHGRRGVSAWSSPSLFEVEAALSQDEFKRSLEVVRRYLAATEGESRPPVQQAAAETAPVKTREKAVAERRTPPAALDGSNFSIDAVGNVEANSFFGPLDCSGCISTGDILQYTITADDIAAWTITGVEIAENSITDWHIQDRSIFNDDIVLNTIKGDRVEDWSLTGVDIAGDSIVSNHIVDGEVGLDDMDSDSVGNIQLRDVVPVSVECESDCTTVTLQNACDKAGTGYKAIGISCQNVKDWTGSSCGSGSGKCSAGSFGSGSDVDEFCDDVLGWDAVVFCLND